MNSAELDRLGNLIGAGTVPEWVRTYVEKNRSEIMQKLSAGETVIMEGPYGQKITIRSTAPAAA